jgi:hypothetical protein
MSITFVNDHRQKLDTSVDSKFRSTDCDAAQVESSSTYNAEHDQRDMRRLGKHQELKVRSYKCSRGISSTFQFLSIVGYIIVLGHMACPHSHFRHVHGHVVDGGDG